ncbi:hypothetical protein ANO11243_095700 [Dothideomycetidae sp. 11243]|nr:hypothetical protein ANO11243_095700 [fungal sp. No.11243]
MTATSINIGDAAKTTWKDCTRFTETFCKVDDLALKCDILLPPGLKHGSHPMILTFHGGYLIAGARDHYPFLAKWLPGYAALHSAMIISADYRLLPSASATEVCADLEELWTWVQSHLADRLAARAPGHAPDLTRVIVQGGSAGGFCAAQLALSHPEAIRAALLIYPMVHCTSTYLADGPPNSAAVAEKMQLLTGEALESEIEIAMNQGWTVARHNAAGLKLTISIVKTGKYGAAFGSKANDPIERVRTGDGHGLPAKVWILHGQEDSGVPLQGSVDFAKEIERSPWDAELVLDIVDDQPSEHGFDREWLATHEKLAPRLNWVAKTWLA